MIRIKDEKGAKPSIAIFTFKAFALPYPRRKAIRRTHADITAYGHGSRRSGVDISYHADIYRFALSASG